MVSSLGFVTVVVLLGVGSTLTLAKLTEIICDINEPFMDTGVKIGNGHSTQIISNNTACNPVKRGRFTWTKGIQLKGNCKGQIKKGTGVAMFEDNETSFRKTLMKNRHAGLFLACGGKEIKVLHQGGSGGQVVEFFQYDGPGIRNGTKYYVVNVEE